MSALSLEPWLTAARLTGETGEDLSPGAGETGAFLVFVSPPSPWLN